MSRGSEQRKRERAIKLAQEAVAQHRSGNLGEAARRYEQVLRLVPPSAALLCNLGEAYRGLDRKPEAVEAFGRALALQPGLAPAHFNRALTLDQLGRFAEAAAGYEAALRLEPTLPNALLFLVQSLRDQGEQERALEAYERFRAAVPESAELLRAVGNALADRFEIDDAAAHFERALELGPGSADLRVDYAAALIERGEVPGAIAELRRALELEPASIRAHQSLLYLLAFPAEADGCAILAEARRFDAVHCRPLARPAGYSNEQAGGVACASATFHRISAHIRSRSFCRRCCATTIAPASRCSATRTCTSRTP